MLRYSLKREEEAVAAQTRAIEERRDQIFNSANQMVLGLGSHPSCDPNLVAELVRESDYKALTSVENGAPHLALQPGQHPLHTPQPQRAD